MSKSLLPKLLALLTTLLLSTISPSTNTVKAQENTSTTLGSIPVPKSGLIEFQLIGSFSGSLQYSITSPENTIYNVNVVSLNVSIRTTNGFRFGYSNYVNEIFYSLDGNANVSIPFTYTITGSEGIQHYNYRASTVLTDLSDGDHNIKVYAAYSYPFALEAIDFAIKYSLKTSEPTLTFSYPTPISSVQPIPISSIESNSQLLPIIFSDPTTIILGVVTILAALGILGYIKKHRNR